MEENSMNVALDKLGRYQIIGICVALLVQWLSAVYNMGYNFFAATPDHWCAFNTHSQQENLTEYQWKLISIPSKIQDGHRKFSQCQIYCWASSPNISSTEIWDLLNSPLNGTAPVGKNLKSCTRWEYDRVSSVQDSLVTEHNLVCDRAWLKSTVASVYAIGAIIGWPAFGYLADMFGRRKVLILTSLATVAFGIGLAFCENLLLFIVMRLIVSCFINGANCVSFTYAMEIVNQSRRSLVASLLWITWAIGEVVLTGIAYFLRKRFDFMLISALCTGVILIPIWFIPESRHWLIAKGYSRENVRSLVKTNKQQVHKHSLESDNDEDAGEETNCMDLVRTPSMRMLSFILWINWFTDTMIFYAISWNASDIAGNIYLNVFLSGAVELPAYIITVPLLEKIGRRISFAGTNILAGVFMLCSMAAPAVQVTMIMLSKFFVTISFSVLYQWTTELYPTVARSSGLGVANIWARTGALVSPYLPLLGPWVLPSTCGFMCIVATIPSFLLPETRDKMLPSNVKEAETMAKKAIFQRVNCCKRNEEQALLSEENGEEDYRSNAGI